MADAIRSMWSVGEVVTLDEGIRIEITELLTAWYFRGRRLDTGEVVELGARPRECPKGWTQVNDVRLADMA